MDFDVERVERLERRLRGWEVVVKGGLGVVLLVLTVRVWVRCLVSAHFRGYFEEVMEPGSRIPQLSEWVMDVGKSDVFLLLIGLVGLAGIIGVIWLPRVLANWVVLICLGSLLFVDGLLTLGFEIMFTR